MDFILLCLFIAAYFDITLLRRRKQPLFDKVFCVSIRQIAVGALLFIAVLAFSSDKLTDFSPLVSAFLSCRYIFLSAIVI